MSGARMADLSAEELDALSAISLSEREQSAAAWRVDTDPIASNLLDAPEHVGDA